MEDIEIFTLAMKQAVKKGYKSRLSVIMDVFPIADDFIKNGYHLQDLFSHSFAKAIWGETSETCIICGSQEFEGKRCGSPMDTEDWVKVCKSCGVEAIDRDEFGIPDGTTMKSWQWHLQQMVIENEPVKYLEKFITTSHS